MKYKLSDFINFKNGKKRPIEEGAIPVYGGNGVLGFTNEYNNENCVIVGRVGAYCGSVYYESNKCWVSDNAIVANEKNNADIRFVYYLLSNLNLNKRHIGTGQPLLTQEILNKIECYLPSIIKQKKIAKILSSLDDKIELNNRINKNLEEQAKALFKEFFIDNIESEKWKTGTFSNLIIATLGGDWGKDCPIGNFTQKVYCIRGADIPNVKVGDIGKMPTRYILAKNLVSKKLANGDIVIEISGGSPTQSTGRCMVVTNELLERYNSDMICTNFCRAIKPINYYTMFIYYYWQFLYDKGVFFSYENGTTGIKNLDINGFLESEQIIIPPENLILKFNNYCESIISKIIDNGKQNERLAQLRDTLLPKLMNGEIDVDKMEI